jgi:hypothetical protein
MKGAIFVRLSAAPVLAAAVAAAAPEPAAPAAPADRIPVPVLVEAPVDTLRLGAPFDVELRLAHPGLEKIRLDTAEEALEPFEMAGWRRELDRGDTANVVLTLRAFRVGALVLRPLVLGAEDAAGNPCLAETDSLRFVVASIVPEDATDIRDIHEAVALRRPLPWWPFAAAGLVVGAGIAIVLWLRHRRRQTDEGGGLSARPADETALLALDRLGRSETARRGPWKTYYTDMAGIVRVYLARRFGVEAPDLTTTETLRALRALELPGAATEALRAVLTEADAVKFAKGTPLAGAPLAHLEAAIRFVRLTTPAAAPAGPGERTEPAGVAAGGRRGS